MQIVLRSISYFRKDLWLIATLLVLIGASVLLNLLNAWPMAILVDTVLSQENAVCGKLSHRAC
jgi:subfamily B ATP-binding cassette protein MsbA